MKNKARLILITLAMSIAVNPGLKAQDHSNHYHAAGQDMVFAGFPIHPEDYQEDVRPIMMEAIEKYGAEEWRAVVLTMEMHSHLGIYALVGAKMGVLAREHFGAGMDHLSVLSYAGLRPPVSCMNDGLQCSTGATIGHGLLTLAPTDQPVPEAAFSHQGQVIRIKLKEDVQEKVKTDVDALRQEYGLESEQYWLGIRELALHYWLILDRKEIFEIRTD